MILYCVPKLRLMGQKFSIREKMDISDLQVGDPFLPPHSPGRAQNRDKDMGSDPCCTCSCTPGHWPTSLSLCSVGDPGKARPSLRVPWPGIPGWVGRILCLST